MLFPDVMSDDDRDSVVYNSVFSSCHDVNGVSVVISVCPFLAEDKRESVVY